MTLNSHIQNILKNSKKDTEWKKEAEERLKARNESKKSGMIATQLAIYMAEKGITQTALGEMTGVSPQQISKILKGRENLTLATIEKIENALGIHLIQVNILEETEDHRMGFRRLNEVIKKAQKKSQVLSNLRSIHDASFISDLWFKRYPTSMPINFGEIHFQDVSMPLKNEVVVNIATKSKKYEVFDEPYPISIAAEEPGEYLKFSFETYE